MKKIIFLIFLTMIPCNNTAEEKKFDLTVVGFVDKADGIGRQAIGIIDCLKNDISINFINTRKKRPINIANVSPEVSDILLKQETGSSNVSILEDMLTNGSKTRPEHYYQSVPQSTVKLAYSMFESTAIPNSWVEILNNHFDAVIVPDTFLVKVYENSGVLIPIYVLPLGIYIEHFLKNPDKKCHQKPFVFGFSGAFSGRKNHELLIESFAKEFGNRDDVILKIHGRFGNQMYLILKKLISQLNVSNIELVHKNFSEEEYINFINSIDCYVSITKGEGFSITPREALAAGIPSIISDNTGQKTICQSGYVYAVKSDIQIPAFYEHLQEYIGYNFNCTSNDVQKALRDIYTNYEYYLEKTRGGRQWVQQYLYKNLRNDYLTLIKPIDVILGTENRIDNNKLITNNQLLYKKYRMIIDQKYS